MEELVVTTSIEEETRLLAEKLGKLLKSGDFIALSGDLGAGKTAFAKGVAVGLEVDEQVTSPTFTIIQEYLGRVPLYHFDTYRIGECWELEDIGYEEYFYGDGVCLVEWPEKVDPLLPEEYLQVNIYKVGQQGEQAREIRFKPRGDRYLQVVEELNKIVSSRN